MYAAAVAVAGAAAWPRAARRRAEQGATPLRERPAFILRARKPSRHILLKSAKNGGGVGQRET